MYHNDIYFYIELHISKGYCLQVGNCVCSGYHIEDEYIYLFIGMAIQMWYQHLCPIKVRK